MKLGFVFCLFVLAAVIPGCPPLTPVDGGPPPPIVNVDSGTVQTIITTEQYACMAVTLADDFLIPPGTPADAIVQKLIAACHVSEALTGDILAFINSFSLRRSINRLERAQARVEAVVDAAVEVHASADAGPPRDAGPPKKR